MANGQKAVVLANAGTQFFVPLDYLTVILIDLLIGAP